MVALAFVIPYRSQIEGIDNASCEDSIDRFHGQFAFRDRGSKHGYVLPGIEDSGDAPECTAIHKAVVAALFRERAEHLSQMIGIPIWLKECSKGELCLRQSGLQRCEIEQPK